MGQTCGRCARVNPAEASYCYFDGVALGGQAVNSGPVNAGKRAFRQQFVFPSGQACQNFDQLALACQQNWSQAADVLTKGYFESFLNNIGRADLAQSARQAAKFPDRERALDQFLDALPSEVLQPPKLHVDALQLNLGQLKLGDERKVQLHLRNQGMRLVYGSVTSSDIWLAVGDAPGAQAKLIQFGKEFVLPVLVRGKSLRASSKPLEGKLVIETNGGTMTVMVRAEVPVKPFPEGALAGARSPRQLAEKAKVHSKDAAAAFEKGTVAQWYKDNGWIYPVQGPVASGMSAIQQFFEALGLSRPPRVDISDRTLNLKGAAGGRVEHTLEVRTSEKRAVYAYAKSSQAWLQPGPPRFNGRVVTLPIAVPSVPGKPGETLQAKLWVTANGNQKFTVPVVLAVGEGVRPQAAAPVAAIAASAAAPPVRAAAPAPVVVSAASATAPPVRAAAPSPVVVSAASAAAPPVRAAAPAPPKVEKEPIPMAQRSSPPPPPPPPPPRPSASQPTTPASAAIRANAPPPPANAVQPANRSPAAAIPDIARKAMGGNVPPWAHLIIAVSLAFVLFLVGLHDLFLKGDGGSVEGGDGIPRITINFHERGVPHLSYPSMRFGLVMTNSKKLTYDETGLTNNTCLRVDGSERLFGTPPGQWLGGNLANAKIPLSGRDAAGRPRNGFRSVWEYPTERLLITQNVELVPGDQTHQLDTALVRYLIENKDGQAHTVGLRFLLDCFIGANDGVPYTIPGGKGLCDTMHEFNSPVEIPDFIQALEFEDLRNPGTVAQVKLKLGGKYESPSRVTLGAWPHKFLAKVPGGAMANQHMTMWEVPVLPMKTIQTINLGSQADSAVTIYWNDQVIPPGGSREVGFSYGLGMVSSDSGDLGLTVGGDFSPGGTFTLTAYVKDPGQGQTLSLMLPEGFQSRDGLMQLVPPLAPELVGVKRSQVSWKIVAGPNKGTFPLRVQASTGAQQTIKVSIRSTGIFD